MAKKPKLTMDDEILLATLYALHKNREDAVSGQRLSEDVFGYPLTRELRKSVTRLRYAGYPICYARGKGYYYGTTPKDIKDTARFLIRHSIPGIKQAARMMKVSMSKVMGQLDMYE